MNENDLYDKFLNDSLSESEEKELLEVLKDEKQANEFAEYIIETNMMISTAENVEALELQKNKSRTENRLSIMIAAAMVILGLFLYFQPQKSQYTVLASTNPDYKNGDTLSYQSIYLDEGEISIKSTSGNILKFKAPVNAILESEEQMELTSGLMTLTLSPEVENFTVLTPHGMVKDLGTSFGLSVKKERSTVHLYSGIVLVKSPSNERTLKVGEAVSLTKNGKIEDSEYIENLFNKKEAEILVMGDRELRPGEQMELILDKSGKSLTAQLQLEYEEEEDFKYKILAYSKDLLVFESNEFTSKAKPKVDIPIESIKDLKIEMKVTAGFVTKGILHVKNLSLNTVGYRPYEGDTLIDSGAMWQYLFTRKPSQNWMSGNFDSSSWEVGKASLGYGDSDLITKIGGNHLRKTVSRIYFRQEFNIEDLEINALKKINVNLLADDGALIFLNGREVVRHNLPEGPISDTTTALVTAVKKSGEMIYNNFSISPNSLLMGKNVISVILIQRKGKSSDMRFDLKLSVF